ncbi:hypothetical protein BTA51_00190 [Hahella sp. CCB-MM4]|uniref:N-acetylneuraminate synthase family protein n=1 Tax=Hahella sp. (strain CCB-MM4) TaxID=1926491 RepID=UPI000B9A1F8A|nr:N-acetylneuraminate synthase family protein [Hahella sp. CCB-MM4]OZG74869.1 hypothetical protein BTA51_00190 [Hahella sp. CCB-MM4]
MLRSRKNAAYIIAEVGQNHQGDLNLAKKYVRQFADAGADAIKFQKRDMATLFEPLALSKEYNSENAFGETYGEHREALELSIEEMAELKEECSKFDVDFMCTAFDRVSLHQLKDIGTQVIKMASFDMGNVPFLQEVIESDIPFVISAGGANADIVDATVEYLIGNNAKFSLLHCVSRYPCRAEELTLGRITLLKEKYPSVQVGLSDHFNGILSGAVGYQLGAEVFEKHVTFDRSWRGTDHSFALTLHGFENFVRDINRTQQMLRHELPEGVGTEAVFKKLGKKIVAATDIKSGEYFDVKNLSCRINGEGVPVRDSVRLIGKLAKRDYKSGEYIDVSEI